MKKSIDDFCKKYSEYSNLYPEYFNKQNKRLESKIKKLVKLNKTLLNDKEYAMQIIDRLLYVDDECTGAIIAQIACMLDYRKEESLDILKKYEKKYCNSPLGVHLEFKIREFKELDK